MNSATIYAMGGMALFVIGAGGLILQAHFLRKIIAFNLMGSGIFLSLVGIAQRDGMPDPIPQAMVLTGIVVAVAATALALALARHLHNITGSMSMPEKAADD